MFASGQLLESPTRIWSPLSLSLLSVAPVAKLDWAPSSARQLTEAGDSRQSAGVAAGPVLE